MEYVNTVLPQSAMPAAKPVLLGYAGIYKLIGEFFPKRLQHTEAQIACDKHNIFILFSYIHKGFNKRVSQSNYLL